MVFIWRGSLIMVNRNLPPFTYSAAPARGLPPKGELIHELYNGKIHFYIEVTLKQVMTVFIWRGSLIMVNRNLPPAPSEGGAHTRAL